jgi:hypothetical protein
MDIMILRTALITPKTWHKEISDQYEFKDLKNYGRGFYATKLVTTINLVR